MALPVTIPNTFANATASIPLSQLDANFNTLANAVNGISDGSESLANVSVTGGTISNVAVSATTLNTSGQVVFNDAGADVDFRVEGDTDANLLFVDASADRVGIGTSSPTQKLQVAGQVLAGTCVLAQNDVLTTPKFTITNETENRRFAINTESAGIAFNVDRPSDSAANNLIIKTGGSERMRIDSSGNLLVGTTSAIAAFSTPQIHVVNDAAGGQTQFAVRNSSTTAGHSFQFGHSSGDQFAIYSYDGTTFKAGQYMTWNTTSWTANSDERLKTDLEPIKDAANKVSTLRAVTGRYKTDEEGLSRSFLIAQDVQAVFPEAVDVQTDENKTLGLRYTDVIPLLVAAIKELKAELDTVKAELATLKG